MNCYGLGLCKIVIQGLKYPACYASKKKTHRSPSQLLRNKFDIAFDTKFIRTHQKALVSPRSIKLQLLFKVKQIYSCARLHENCHLNGGTKTPVSCDKNSTSILKDPLPFHRTLEGISLDSNADTYQTEIAAIKAVVIPYPNKSVLLFLNAFCAILKNSSFRFKSVWNHKTSIISKYNVRKVY